MTHHKKINTTAISIPPAYPPDRLPIQLDAFIRSREFLPPINVRLFTTRRTSKRLVDSTSVLVSPDTLPAQRPSPPLAVQPILRNHPSPLLRGQSDSPQPTICPKPSSLHAVATHSNPHLIVSRNRPTTDLPHAYRRSNATSRRSGSPAQRYVVGCQEFNIAPVEIMVTVAAGAFSATLRGESARAAASRTAAGSDPAAHRAATRHLDADDVGEAAIRTRANIYAERAGCNTKNRANSKLPAGSIEWFGCLIPLAGRRGRAMWWRE